MTITPTITIPKVAPKESPHNPAVPRADSDRTIPSPNPAVDKDKAALYTDPISIVILIINLCFLK